ncbi:MAG: response regulator transcription factor [Anaerolineae bacterium]
MTRRVLVVEQDPPLSSVLSLGLNKNGHGVRAVASGREALEVLGHEAYALVVLDADLLDLAASDFRQATQMTGVPVLVLTGLTTEASILDHFQAGADDVLRKPFGMREFAARTIALLRRAPPADGGGRTGVLHNLDLRVDLSRHAAIRGVQTLRLTPTEFRLLTYFMCNSGRTIPHQELLTEI